MAKPFVGRLTTDLNVLTEAHVCEALYLLTARNWGVGNRGGEGRRQEGDARCMACKKDSLG